MIIVAPSVTSVVPIDSVLSVGDVGISVGEAASSTVVVVVAVEPSFALHAHDESNAVTVKSIAQSFLIRSPHKISIAYLENRCNKFLKCSSPLNSCIFQ